jgi:pimeloyl-ACP methyl ester carboxylesterase
LIKEREEKIMLSIARYGKDKFTEVEGYRLHYVDAGTGDPVIMIPGAYGTYRAWNRVIPRLSEHYRLLALDYIGTGDSDKPQKGFRYTVQEQASLITKLIKQLDLGQVHLIGSSYGGVIVLYLSAYHPELVNKVVSIEGGVVIPKKLPGSPLEFAFKYPIIGDLFTGLLRTGILNGVLLKSIAGQWYASMTETDRKEFMDYLQYNAKSASRIAWQWVSISHKTCEDFEEAAKTMKMPILYLYGTASDFMEPHLKDNIQFLETYLPNVKIIGLEGGIHDLELQKPDEVMDLVLNFLKM